MVGLLRLSPGAVFAGDFEVRQILAKGGMGTVYAVRDNRSGEERALKVLLPELVADENSRRRFAQEAWIAAEIDSPYVPRIYHAGIDERTGVPFIVMDLLKGRDLRRRVAESGPPPLEEAARIFEQLGHALGAAHRVGLVHRDLKPENVFLDEGVSPYEVRLLDFGVAKVIDAHRTSATGTGAIGSPMWMAPEQTSAGGRISPATDVWALGLLTFFVLTGKLFWKAAQDHSGVAGLLRELHVDPIPLPSEQAGWLGIAADLPPGYDAWFARAVARDPGARFRDADEAMAALRPALATSGRPADRSALAYAQTMEVSRAEVSAATAARRTTPMGSVGSSGAPPDAPIGDGVASPQPEVASAEPPREPSLPAAPSRERSGEVAIPRTDPPPPMVAAPARRTSPLVWAALVIVVGLAVASLSAVIVWVALTLSEPGDGRRRPPPAPSPPSEPHLPAHPEPMEPLEVVPSGAPEGGS